MKPIFLLLALFSFGQIANAQTIYEEFESYKLGESRELKIQLPRNYEENEDKLYPLFIVLDGDYLFELVAANVDYYSYWEDMPEALVVGINQVDSRFADFEFSEQNSLPIEQGARFFEFISMELLPMLYSEYRLAPFKVVVGHGESANFLNYFLFKDQPLFQGYISVSPTLAAEVPIYLEESFANLGVQTFYYMASSTNDIAGIQEDTENLDKALSLLENPKISYEFEIFEGPTHYGCPAHAIPNALESIFYVFQPISKKEYKEKILTFQGSPVTYLTDKYALIKDQFGIDKEILINDFKAIEAAIEKNKSFNFYEALGKLARKQYPDTLLGNYYLARFYEETGEPKKAMRTYRSAYILDEIGGITKDLMLEKADAIKADFGF